MIALPGPPVSLFGRFPTEPKGGYPVVPAASLLVVLHSAAPGGIERLHLSAATRLARRGVRITLCCLVEEGTWAPRFRAAGVEVVALGGLSTAVPGAWLRNLKAVGQLASLMRRERPDAVHTEMFYAGTVGRLAARLAGVPVIVQGEHNVYPERGPLHRTIERLCARWTHRVVAPTEAIAAVARARLGLAPDRVVVVPNGVEPPPKDLPDRLEARRRLALPAQGHVLALCGRLVPQKRPETVLAAAELLAPTRADLRVLVVGDGPLRGSLEARARASALSGRVLFTGAVDEPATLVAAADLLLVPSEREGFALAPAEALLAGVPPLLADLPALREVYGSLGEDLFVREDEPRAWAGAAAAWLDADERRRDVVAAGSALIRGRHDPEAMADRLAALYAGGADGSGGAG